MYLKLNIYMIQLYWKENEFYVIKVHTIPIYNDVVLKKKKCFSVTGTVLPPYPKWKNVTSIKPFSLMVGTNSKRSNFMSIFKEICCSLKKKIV